MLKRVLVANRGEIALRIVRACRELDLETVAAYTKVDSNQRHLDLVDEAVCIGDVNYLDVTAILAAATSRGCQAIHPGYGLLSEDANFARQVESAGLMLIGPAAETIALMGDKVSASAIAADFGFDVPGLHGICHSLEQARSQADQVGYPVLVKAAFGGGGRGMRIAARPTDLASAFTEAEAEAFTTSGRGEVYIERYLTDARHIEVQVLGDGKGNAIHLGTRDCSIQRRYQKLIEEAPAPFVDAKDLEALANRCSAFAASMNYSSAGTLEFLYEHGVFFFIEMNTRIQVEHPVTEAVTSIDLVKAQLEIAMHGVLPVAQGDVCLSGHAIECRVNAESFSLETGKVMPGPGLVERWIVPGGPGIRVDTHLYLGYKVPHQYDSLVAKLVCTGRDRDEAIARLRRALWEFEVSGIDTNIEPLKTIVSSAAFARGINTTRFLEQFRKQK